jgi:glycosyltransferase involved in cell wall biosynthesis
LDIEMIKVLFLIPTLEQGGAQRQLVELIKGVEKSRFAVTLVTFLDGGDMQSEINGKSGVKFISLKKRGRWGMLPLLFRFWRVAREVQPQIIYGYMSLASELCLLIGWLVRAKVVWSLRASNVDYAQYNWALGYTFRAGAWLSRLADLVIVNSFAGKQYHLDHGYDSKNMIVISNGIDTEYYRPDLEARHSTRMKWCISEHETVIGLVGRVDIMKGYSTFLRAAAELAKESLNVKFVCVGHGSESYMSELRAMGDKLGLRDRLIWAGSSNCMVAIYNALDLLTSTSIGEGFSNVIGEAMACGVPCVVTDVGDSALIVGETGSIVPPNAPSVVAKAWRDWLSMPKETQRLRRLQARSRIEHKFNLHTMVTKTESALLDLQA